MATILLSLRVGTLSPNYCFSNWQQTLLDFGAQYQTELTASTFFSIGSTKPDPAFNAFPWFKTVTDAFGPTGLYQFSGIWFMPVWPFDVDERRSRFGTEPSVWSFDGGDGNNPTITPPTANSGAMWEVDHTFDGRSPIGAGLIPNDISPARTLAVGDTVGEGGHLQGREEVGPHTHLVWPADGGDNNIGKKWSHTDPGGESCDVRLMQMIRPNILCAQQTELLADTIKYAATQQKGNVLHPVKALWIIKRTIRSNYVVP